MSSVLSKILDFLLRQDTPDIIQYIFSIFKAFSDSALLRVAVISAKNHKRQRRKRQSVTAKREGSQTPKVLTAILTLPNQT